MKQWLCFCLRLVAVWGLVIFLIITQANFSPTRAATFNAWSSLKAGELDEEFWELILGKWSDWRIVEGRLQADLQPPPNVSAIIPRDQLWSVSGDYEFSFDYLPLDEADKNLAVYFGHDFKSNGSVGINFLSFHFINGQVHIDHYVRGFASRNCITPFILNPGQVYQVKITYRSPDFILLIDDQEVFSTRKTDFWPDYETGGRPMFFISSGIFSQSQAIFSNFSLNLLSKLNLTYFSQLNPLWASQHYAHSGLSLTPRKTIADWGCALTSAVMLLDYYGYDSFGDGQAITPSTLNAWLQNQADGYLAESLVNWLAVSRLTYLLNAAQPEIARPVLEYHFAHFDEDLLSEQLKKNQPVIAAVGAHFLVIIGQDEEDYWVADPQDEDDLLSDHYDEIESLRIFEASQTDLSYFLFSSPEALDFTVQNLTTEQELPMLTNRLAFANREHYLYYWPQPSSGRYLLNFDNSKQLTNAQLFTYQSRAEVQIFNLSDFQNNNQDSQELELIYDKNDDASLFKRSLIYHQLYLDYLLALKNKQLELKATEGVQRYQQLIKRFLDFEQL